MIDIVLPENNEEAFLDMAERLGIEGVCFLYDGPKDVSQFQKRKVKVFSATFQLSKRAELRLTRGPEGLRDILEKTNMDIAFELEEGKDKDFMHQRNSGLNHILCAIARERGQAIAFSARSLLTSAGRARSTILGRMMQNVRLCRKYKVGMCLASFARTPWQMRGEGELQALGMTIGMLPGEVKQATRAVAALIARNSRRREPDYLGEGIERI